MYKQLRTLLIATVLVTLSGCGIFGASFDNNEYAGYARLHAQTTVAVGHCTDFDMLRSDIDRMSEQVEFLHVYTKHLTDNDESYNIQSFFVRTSKS